MAGTQAKHRTLLTTLGKQHSHGRVPIRLYMLTVGWTGGVSEMSSGGVSSRDLVASTATRLMLLSAAFRCSFQEGDTQIAALASGEAQGLLNILSLTIRREYDAGRGQNSAKDTIVGRVIEKAEPAAAQKICQDRAFPAQGESNLTFYNSLNKIAHLDPAASSFRVDERDHFLLLSGKALNDKTKVFLAELEVRALAQVSLRALPPDAFNRSGV